MVHWRQGGCRALVERYVESLILRRTKMLLGSGEPSQSPAEASGLEQDLTDTPVLVWEVVKAVDACSL